MIDAKFFDCNILQNINGKPWITKYGIDYIYRMYCNSEGEWKSYFVFNKKEVIFSNYGICVAIEQMEKEGFNEKYYSEIMRGHEILKKLNLEDEYFKMLTDTGVVI